MEGGEWVTDGGGGSRERRNERQRECTTDSGGGGRELREERVCVRRPAMVAKSTRQTDGCGDGSGGDGSSDNEGVNRDGVKINWEESVLGLENRGENEIWCFRWFS